MVLHLQLDGEIYRLLSTNVPYILQFLSELQVQCGYILFMGEGRDDSP